MDDITMRLFSVDTPKTLAAECVKRGITPAQRVQEEIDDAAADGFPDCEDPAGQCEKAITEAMAAK